MIFPSGENTYACYYVLYDTWHASYMQRYISLSFIHIIKEAVEENNKRKKKEKETKKGDEINYLH